MNGVSDPRVYFAAERTLMAWLRTGIAIIGLGFLVARFGVYMMIARDPVVEGDQLISSLIGTSFTLLGTVAIAVATWQHRNFRKSLSQSELPAHYSMALSLLVGSTMSLAGLALAVYLAATSAATSATVQSPLPGRSVNTQSTAEMPHRLESAE